MIKRVCMVYVSERKSDCRGVGGRMYDVEGGEVRCGPIGSGGVISHTAEVTLSHTCLTGHFR